MVKVQLYLQKRIRIVMELMENMFKLIFETKQRKKLIKYDTAIIMFSFKIN